jgi:hypothetical protein
MKMGAASRPHALISVIMNVEKSKEKPPFMYKRTKLSHKDKRYFTSIFNLLLLNIE